MDNSIIMGTTPWTANIKGQSSIQVSHTYQTVQTKFQSTLKENLQSNTMCFQRFETFSSCQHMDLIEELCNDPHWPRTECPAYESLSHENSHELCGYGRYYCGLTADGQTLNLVHQHFEHAQALVSWSHAQADKAFCYLKRVEQAFKAAKIHVRVQAAHQIMIRAVRAHRKMMVASTRARYLSSQFQRKISFAKSHFEVDVPMAMQQGDAVPTLALPDDEPWQAPPFDFRSASDIYPPVEGFCGVPTGQPHPYPASMQRALKYFTAIEDLGTLYGTESYTALDNLPIGCLSGDRSTAIAELARKTAYEIREQGNIKAHVHLSQPTKRKRSRANTVCSKADSVTPGQFTGGEPVSKKRRAMRSVKRVDYTEDRPSSHDSQSDAQSVEHTQPSSDFSAQPVGIYPSLAAMDGADYVQPSYNITVDPACLSMDRIDSGFGEHFDASHEVIYL